MDTGSPPEILHDEDCMKWIKSLKKLSRIQSRASDAQIDAREKRRQAGFRRRDVWLKDSLFMIELQRLTARQKLDGFEELLKLAEDCQAARNELGPFEEEGTQAEQRMESELWKLQQEEESVYYELKQKLRPTKSYTGDRSMSSSTEYKSSTETDISTYRNDRLPPDNQQSINSSLPAVNEPEEPVELGDNISQEATLYGVHEDVVKDGRDEKFEGGSDSGFGNIDQPSGTWSGTHSVRLQTFPPQANAVLERYPGLLRDFDTRRDRINKWLLHTTLLSHLEADILADQFRGENGLLPSNWSQLVIAYWELDEAAVPYAKRAISPRSV